MLKNKHKNLAKSMVLGMILVNKLMFGIDFAFFLPRASKCWKCKIGNCKKSRMWKKWMSNSFKFCFCHQNLHQICFFVMIWWKIAFEISIEIFVSMSGISKLQSSRGRLNFTRFDFIFSARGRVSGLKMRRSRILPRRKNKIVAKRVKLSRPREP